MQSSVSIVKAIIVKYFKFLVLVRRKDGLLDLPGGKLEEGEGVCQGLVREVSEETGLVFERPEPVNRWIFPTAKGMLNGITFCCEYKKGRVILSREHTHYFWQGLKFIKSFTPQIWMPELGDMKGGIILIQCPLCGLDQDSTFPRHYIFKEYPENYLEMQKPPESVIMFPPRMP